MVSKSSRRRTDQADSKTAVNIVNITYSSITEFFQYFVRYFVLYTILYLVDLFLIVRETIGWVDRQNTAEFSNDVEWALQVSVFSRRCSRMTNWSGVGWRHDGW